MPQVTLPDGRVVQLPYTQPAQAAPQAQQISTLPQVSAPAQAAPTRGGTAAPAAAAPAGGLQPPESPEAFAQLKAGWRDFFGKLQRSPELSQALFSLGVNLIQPIQPGQSELGHIGQALDAGRTAWMGEKERQAQAQQQQTENVLAERQVSAQEEGVDVRREAVAQRRTEAERRAELQGRELDIKETTAETSAKAQRSLSMLRQAQADYYTARAEQPYAPSQPGAQQQLITSLARVLMATEPDKYPDFETAWRAAFDRTKTTGQTTPQQLYADLLSNSVDIMGIMEATEQKNFVSMLEELAYGVFQQKPPSGQPAPEGENAEPAPSGDAAQPSERPGGHVGPSKANALLEQWKQRDQRIPADATLGQRGTFDTPQGKVDGWPIVSNGRVIGVLPVTDVQ